MMGNHLHDFREYAQEPPPLSQRAATLAELARCMQERPGQTLSEQELGEARVPGNKEASPQEVPVLKVQHMSFEQYVQFRKSNKG